MMLKMLQEIFIGNFTMGNSINITESKAAKRKCPVTQAPSKTENE